VVARSKHSRESFMPLPISSPASCHQPAANRIPESAASRPVRCRFAIPDLPPGKPPRCSRLRKLRQAEAGFDKSTQGPPLCRNLATNPNLYLIVGGHVKRDSGRYLPNELSKRTQNMQTLDSTRDNREKAAKVGFKNEPKRTQLRADFWRRRHTKSTIEPNEPEKRTRETNPRSPLDSMRF
jgi:hypothetical protein